MGDGSSARGLASSWRDIMPNTLSRKLQFQFGLLDLVVRDTLTQLRAERTVSRGRLCKAVMSCLIVLSLFVPPHRPVRSSFSSFLVIVVVVALVASRERPLLCLSLASVASVTPWQSCRRVPRMLGIVSGIVLAYPLTSYLWDSNVSKIDTETPLFAYGDSPDGPQGITVA